MMGDGTKLGDIFLFDGAPEAAAMAEGCPIVSYSRGEIIYDPSACRRALGVVLSGRAEAVSALQEKTVLSGFTGALDDLLRKGVSNSAVILERLRDLGYAGGLTVIKEYIAKHRDLLPPKRQIVAPQGNRGRRYETSPGDSFQMDWGFTNVEASTGGTHLPSRNRMRPERSA